MQHSASRRSFLRSGALTALGTTVFRSTQADEPPHLAVQDPAARALGYVEDAAQADSRRYPSFVSGSNCENCLQLQGKAGNPYRPCTLFPGKLVATRGWCSGWAAEM